MVFPGDVMENQLRGVVANEQLLVEEPPVSDVGWIGISVATQSYLGTLGNSAVII